MNCCAALFPRVKPPRPLVCHQTNDNKRGRAVWLRISRTSCALPCSPSPLSTPALEAFLDGQSRAADFTSNRPTPLRRMDLPTYRSRIWSDNFRLERRERNVHHDRTDNVITHQGY